MSTTVQLAREFASVAHYIEQHRRDTESPEECALRWLRQNRLGRLPDSHECPDEWARRYASALACGALGLMAAAEQFRELSRWHRLGRR